MSKIHIGLELLGDAFMSTELCSVICGNRMYMTAITPQHRTYCLANVFSTFGWQLAD